MAHQQLTSQGPALHCGQFMLSKLTKLMVAATLLFTAGAHWTILQSVAWVGMTVSFAQKGPLSEALAKTLDGKHPCQLCKLVQQGKKSEKRQDTQKTFLKIDGFLVAGQAVLTAPSLEPLPCLTQPPHGLSGRAPPSPPPRSLPG